MTTVCVTRIKEDKVDTSLDAYKDVDTAMAIAKNILKEVIEEEETDEDYSALGIDTYGIKTYIHLAKNVDIKAEGKII